MGCKISSVSPIHQNEIESNKKIKKESESNARSVRFIPNKKSEENIKSQNDSSFKSKEEKNHIKMESGLLFREAEKEKENEIHVSSVFSLIKKGDLLGIQKLVEMNKDKENFDLNSTYGMWNSTPLIVSTQYNNEDISVFLLKLQNAHLVINHKNEKGADALLFACMEGMENVVNILLDRILSTNPSLDFFTYKTKELIYNPIYDNSVYCSPLSVLIMNGRINSLKIALDKIDKASFNVFDIISNPFPFPLVKRIRRDVKDKNNPKNFTKGLTPMMLAAAYGQILIFRELLYRIIDYTSSPTFQGDFGIIENACDEDGSNLLHHIVRAKKNSSELLYDFHNNYKISENLLNTADCNGDLPIHIAAQLKNAEAIRFLLSETTLDPSAKNPLTGVTPLHTAIQKRNEEIVNLFIEYGADPLIEDFNGMSSSKLALRFKEDSPIYIAVNKATQAWEALRKAKNSDLKSSAKVETITDDDIIEISILATPRRNVSIDVNATQTPLGSVRQNEKLYETMKLSAIKTNDTNREEDQGSLREILDDQHSQITSSPIIEKKVRSSIDASEYEPMSAKSVQKIDQIIESIKLHQENDIDVGVHDVVENIYAVKEVNEISLNNEDSDPGEGFNTSLIENEDEVDKNLQASQEEEEVDEFGDDDDDEEDDDEEEVEEGEEVIDKNGNELGAEFISPDGADYVSKAGRQKKSSKVRKSNITGILLSNDIQTPNQSKKSKKKIKRKKKKPKTSSNEAMPKSTEMNESKSSKKNPNFNTPVPPKGSNTHSFRRKASFKKKSFDPDSSSIRKDV